MQRLPSENEIDIYNDDDDDENWGPTQWLTDTSSSPSVTGIDTWGMEHGPHDSTT